MKIDSLIRLLAGTVTLVGVALTHFVSPWWLLLPTFVGLNLIQSVFTGFCPPATLLLRRIVRLVTRTPICGNGSKRKQGHAFYPRMSSPSLSKMFEQGVLRGSPIS
jgi:hypothetical protein